jgi:DNA repair exonuclease SbcCD nuclease subunit
LFSGYGIIISKEVGRNIMVNFIHIADLHLGLEFKSVNFDRHKANERRIELWNTFERIVRKAAEDEMDFLLIAGDLFEEEYFTFKDINRVKDTLFKANTVNIVVVAGNHDPLNRKSLYRVVDWPENVTILGPGVLEKKEFPEKNTVIYGYSWDKGEVNEDIFRHFDGLDESKINILLIHGDVLNRESKYLPLDKNFLLQLGFDYIALGHIHKPVIFSEKMAYCGSPEPLDFGETGVHGIIQGSITSKGTNIDFVPFSKRIFVEKTIELSETMGYMDIISKIQGCDDEKNKSKNLYKLTLRGIIDPSVELNIKDMEQSLKDDFYYLEIVDDTTVDYDLDALARENKDNIIGYFIEEMKKKDLKDKVNRQALYIGLEALLKGKVGL